MYICKMFKRLKKKIFFSKLKKKNSKIKIFVIIQNSIIPPIVKQFLCTFSYPLSCVLISYWRRGAAAVGQWGGGGRHPPSHLPPSICILHCTNIPPNTFHPSTPRLFSYLFIYYHIFNTRKICAGIWNFWTIFKSFIFFIYIFQDFLNWVFGIFVFF